MDIKRPKSKFLIPPGATRVFEGEIFSIYQWEQELFDGTKATFEKLARRDSVNILPVTSEGKIVIARQEQPGYTPFWGAIGGGLDEGETALEGARRELKEETGYTAEEFILLDTVQPSFIVDWTIYTFIAKGIRIIEEPRPDAGEKIELHFLTFDEFIEATRMPDYRDKETALLIHRASGNPEKMASLRALFSPR